MTQTDFVQRFVFDKQDARGCIVKLEETCSSIQATHHYPPSLAKLLNEFALSVVLLRDSIKINGSVTIQLRSEGAVSLMMADCSAENDVRAIAEYNVEEFPSAETIDFTQFGKQNKGMLAITITPNDGERYQGIVPIENDTFSECLEDYFRRSEQLPSTFQLMATAEQATGVAVYALPMQVETNESEAKENFTRLTTLLRTLKLDEALELSSEEILTRLYHEEECRLFDSKDVQFGCQCSLQRSLDALISLGKDEIKDLIAEHKELGNEAVAVDCHFCFQKYEFSFEQLEALFAEH